MVVVDANVILAWALKSKWTGAAIRLVRRGESLIAPELAISEVTNALWMLAAREPTRRQDALDALREFPRILNEVVPAAGLRFRAFELALELGHPVYDCLFLALAIERDVPFCTADGRFVRRLEGTPYFPRVQLLAASG
jgi:predicted nucleic acid-binding protein